ncbi:murein biosynthesis integral membrane protein MurJ [Leucobacter sp. HNU]|uniref:murein biosynthesis integral membrane protein MurJ n=1 Tax=Leucobacter sp. HNU TaxID=3236805 RepID=UPI003A7FA050
MAGSLARASAVMASGTMVSRVLGFVKVSLLAFAIGGSVTRSGDAFAIGNLLPNTMYMILLGGMLNAVLVPQIVKAAKDPDGGAGYINRVLTLVVSALAVGTALLLLIAPWIVWLLTAEWGDSQRALATAFAYWCLPQIIFYGLYTVLGEVLNARSVFGPFTWAPVANNVIAIAGIIVYIAMYGADPKGGQDPGAWTSAGIAVLAGSATLGVIVQSLILFISWRRAGIRFRPDFRWKGMGLGQTGRIAGWSLAAIIVMQLGGFITQAVINTSSGHGPSATAMQNAWLLFMTPHSVIAVSLGTAYFTRLAGWGQTGRMPEFVADFSASARQISLVMVLASVAIFTAAPFLARILNPGTGTAQVGGFTIVLQCYIVGLAAYSFLFVVQRSFYALSDTKTPFIFTTIQITLLVLLSLGLLVLPKEMLGAAYALVFAFTTVVEALIAVWMLRRRIGSIDGSRILASLLLYGIASVPALVIGLVLYFLSILVLPDPGMVLSILFAGVMAIVVSAVYLVTLKLIRSPDLAELTAFVSRKLGRNRS